MQMGWSNKPDAMKRAVELHPCWKNHRAVDRRAEQKENDSSSETAKAGAVAATVERTNDDRTPGEERTQ